MEIQLAGCPVHAPATSGKSAKGGFWGIGGGEGIETRIGTKRMCAEGGWGGYWQQLKHQYPISPVCFFYMTHWIHLDLH